MASSLLISRTCRHHSVVCGQHVSDNVYTWRRPETNATRQSGLMAGHGPKAERSTSLRVSTPLERTSCRHILQMAATKTAARLASSPVLSATVTAELAQTTLAADSTRRLTTLRLMETASTPLTAESTRCSGIRTVSGSGTSHVVEFLKILRRKTLNPRNGVCLRQFSAAPVAMWTRISRT